MVEVLRLHHRIPRDTRVSTHCALVARAFGAEKIYYSGMKDKGFECSVTEVVNRFGGDFEIEHIKKDIQFVKKKKKTHTIIHLTMYGTPIQDKIETIRKSKKILIIIGGEKVPGEFYSLADYNLGITNQPHSEISSLSIFLDKYFDGKELSLKPLNAKVTIIPQENGKLLKEK